MLPIRRASCAAAILLLCFGAGAALPAPRVGECPQPRFTGKAPDEYYQRTNPLQAGNAHLKAAERLYNAKDGCAVCHGKKGDGKGPLASQFDPPPRNFACAQTVNGIPDGQLFWIIRFGSPGTSMPEHAEFTDEQIWQIVMYVRRLAN